MRIINLGSGSKGNSTFIQAGEYRLLIDIGFSVIELTRRLETIGESPENIDAVLITHEHVDHIKGFVNFLKKYDAKGYVPEQIYEDIIEQAPEKVKQKIGKVTDNHLWLGEILIIPLDLPHDSKVCKGYCLEYKRNKVSFLTDLGYFPLSILQTIVGSSLVYIESNHDKKMLANCYYPHVVKQRIAGEKGHLSNEQAAQVILELAKNQTKYFVLSHISENSNTVEQAYLTAAKVLENNGFILEKDVFLRYSRQDRPGNNFIFGENNE